MLNQKSRSPDLHPVAFPFILWFAKKRLFNWHRLHACPPVLPPSLLATPPAGGS